MEKGKNKAEKEKESEIATKNMAVKLERFGRNWLFLKKKKINK